MSAPMTTKLIAAIRHCTGNLAPRYTKNVFLPTAYNKKVPSVLRPAVQMSKHKTMLASSFNTVYFVLTNLNTMPGIKPSKPDASVMSGIQGPNGIMRMPKRSPIAPTAKPAIGPRNMPARKQGI